MKLERLHNFDDIVIQCHDNPDADAIASSFGLYLYFLSLGKHVRIIYTGEFIIQKANLRMMIEELCIPITYTKELTKPQLLLTVDCQYGEGNVTKFEADQVAVIDHHEVCCELNDFTEIRSNYSSCSTLVYSMLLEAGYPVNQNRGLATALYYGLYMDTNYFSEIKHPLDMDMIESLTVYDHVIDRLKNSNFSFSELKTAGLALSQYIYNDKYRYAIVKVNPCDPNILGFISDLVLQVENIDSCIVYNESSYGFKMSVRSCMREATAKDIALYLTKAIGSGGGHKKKAGGFIIKNKFNELYSPLDFHEYLTEYTQRYFSSCEIIDTSISDIDTTSMVEYQKKQEILGVVRLRDIAETGTKLNIRTLEGDVEIVTEDNLYLLIGDQGEVKPITKEEFDSNYEVIDKPYELEVDYKPTAKNKRTDKNYFLLQYAKCCISTSVTQILAKQLQVTTKLFSPKSPNSYMVGNVLDYLAVDMNDHKDAYIIVKEDFDILYKKI